MGHLPRPTVTEPHTIELQHLETEPLSDSYADQNKHNEASEHATRRKPAWSAHFSGWRGGVVVAICVTSFVLIVNVVLVILAKTRWNLKDGVATAFSGSCKEAATWTRAMHFVINFLSSLLLGASNYCMQRLVAPTREEVNAAHSRKRWLDIGIPSVRNLTWISKKRAIMWLLLAISSIPLHFVYNSVIFETISANEIDLLVVTPEFFTVKDSWEKPVSTGYGFEYIAGDTYISDLQALVLDGKYSDRSLFENLTAADCQSRYNQSYVSNRGACFAVLTPAYSKYYLKLGLNSSLAANFSGALDQVNEYIPQSSYCLSQITEEKCAIQMSMTILIIVIVCNSVKILIMSLIIWRMNYDTTTITTIGDAIQTFLTRPDPTTEDCCLMSRRTASTMLEKPGARLPQLWTYERRETWGRACTRRRWVACLILYSAAIAVTGAFYGIASNREYHQGHNNFGGIDGNFMLGIQFSQSDSILPPVLIANLPQVLASFIYLTYNGLFTCMLAGREWAKYAVRRAPLRVTIPKPGQRSTHFLELPFRFSIPILGASSLLHWFISESIFVVRIAVYKDGLPFSKGYYAKEFGTDNNANTNIISGLGYSDRGLIASLVWGICLVVACLVVAMFFKNPKGIPLGGTNSAVISAACHLRYDDDRTDKHGDDVAEKPLMWGVTIRAGEDKVGHCSFSAGEVEMPQPDCLYAGFLKKNL